MFAFGHCLANAVAPISRQELSVAGEAVPLGIFVGNWPSNQLVSAVYRILAEEVLGYNISRHYGFANSSWEQLAALAGCLDPAHPAAIAPTSWPECRHEQKGYEFHVSLEVWNAEHLPFANTAEPPFLNFAGSIGYNGVTGFAVLERFLLQGVRALDWYRAYDAELQPWEGFNQIADFPVSKLHVCNETELSDQSKMDGYLRITGDINGVITEAGHSKGNCWNAQGKSEQSGTWWLSPSCRSNPEHCIPFITCSDGWGMEEIMQKSVAFNMPVGVGVAKDCYEVLPWWNDMNFTFYCSNVDLYADPPVFIQFPFHDDFEWSHEVKKTQSPHTRVSKWTAPDFNRIASKAYFLLQALRLDFASLMEMMHQYPPSLGNNPHDHLRASWSIACDWLKRHRSVWGAWLPRETACEYGHGLVDENASFVSEISLGIMCQQCPPGSVSVRPMGRAHRSALCHSCPAGRHQPAAAIQGKDAMSACPKCPAGKYMDNLGAAYCNSCEAGRYQNETGQRGCRDCPGGKYSSKRAEALCIDCEVGTYRPTSGLRRESRQILEAVEMAAKGMTCLPCPSGSYQTESAHTACVACKQGFVTASSGARRERECVCREGFYYNPALDICEACPSSEGLLCPGSHSQVHRRADNTVRIDDGFMTLPGSLNVYACSERHRCSGRRSPFAGLTGVQSPPMCGDSFILQGCSRCPDKYYIIGNKCRLCSDYWMPLGGSLIILIIAVTTTCVAYYYNTMFPPSPITGAYLPVLAFYQALNLSDLMNFDVPESVQKLADVFLVLEMNAELFGFPRGCFVGSKASWQYAAQVTWPFFILSSFMILYVAGNCIPALVCRHLKRNVASPVEFVPSSGIFRRLYEHMELAMSKSVSQIPLSTRMTWFWFVKWDDIFNCIVKTSNALYITLAKSGMYMFMFKRHPGGTITLATIPVVVRLDSTWWSMFPISMVALLLYCVGYLAYAIHAVHIAPRRFPVDAGWRKRHRGLWAKYNPTSWYFSLVGLCYSLSLNIVTVVFISGRAQMLCCIMASMCYIWFATMAMPYKFVLNHQADIFCKFAYLTFMIMTSTTITDEPLKIEDMDELIFICTVGPTVVVMLLMLKFMWYRDVARRSALTNRVAFAYRLMDTISILGGMDRHRVRALSFSLLDNDVTMLDNALDVVLYEVLGLQPPKPWFEKRFCGLHPYQETVPGRLEGEYLARNGKAPYRKLFRDFRDCMLKVDDTNLPSSSLSSIGARAAAHAKHIKKVQKLTKNQDVNHIVRTFFRGSLHHVESFSRQQFTTRMNEIFPDGSCPFSDFELGEIFDGMDLMDRHDVWSDTVSITEFAVQLSYHTQPVYPEWYKPKETSAVYHENEAEPPSRNGEKELQEEPVGSTCI